MKLCEPYPDSVEVSGRVWRLDLSLRRVLAALESREDLTPADAVQVQCAYLLAADEELPEDPGLCAKIVLAVFDLFPKHENKTQEKYLDFEQDAAMIRSAFFRAFGIDLTRDDIHFMQFLELLADLPTDTALMRTVELRQRPVPEINQHNKEQVARLLEAKQRVALKLTEEERRERFQRQIRQNRIYWG